MLIWPKKWNIIKHKNLLSHIKIGKELLTFGNFEIEKKNKFYCHKTPIFYKDVHIEKVLVWPDFFGWKKTLN